MCVLLQGTQTFPAGNGNAVLGESLTHRPEWVLQGWGQSFPGDAREEPMGCAGSASPGQLAATREGDPDAPRLPGVLPVPASRARRAGRAVPPATADGGRQLRSVTSLADPVISISRQVLKSPWKPAWQQPRQHPHSQCPAGASPVAGDRWRVTSGTAAAPHSSRVSVPL